MKKALITFANGDTLVLHDRQSVIPIQKKEFTTGVRVGETAVYVIWKHNDRDIIPSITQLISTSEFFRLLDDDNKVYKSSAVVSIENIE